MHRLFKQHITDFRPQIDIDQVANGDTWYGRECLDNNLVDDILTSDEYILTKRSEGWSVYEVNYKGHKSFVERLGKGVGCGLLAVINRGFNS